MTTEQAAEEIDLRTQGIDHNGVTRTLLTGRELAMRLQITGDQLDVAIERGEIPVIEVADEIRFIFEDVVDAMQKKSFESWPTRDALVAES